GRRGGRARRLHLAARLGPRPGTLLQRPSGGTRPGDQGSLPPRSAPGLLGRARRLCRACHRLAVGMEHRLRRGLLAGAVDPNEARGGGPHEGVPRVRDLCGHHRADRAALAAECAPGPCCGRQRVTALAAVAGRLHRVRTRTATTADLPGASRLRRSLASLFAVYAVVLAATTISHGNFPSAVSLLLVM